VLSLYLKGKTYTEIAKIIGREDKSIDNTLQRIKRKVEKIVEERRNK
jgi:RNA polymerase sporulation-specific sigma factor